MESSAAERLAQQAADAIREVIAGAERRAAEVVREAEATAAQVRERAEAEAAQVRERAEIEAREKIETAKRALDNLGGDLGEASQVPAPTPPPAPAPTAAPQAAAAQASGDGGEAARLVAMKLAVDGKGREEIAAELDARFGSADRGGLLDEVLARAGR